MKRKTELKIHLILYFNIHLQWSWLLTETYLDFFQAFDFGKEAKNIDRYGQPSPPKYNLTKGELLKILNIHQDTVHMENS